jgi:hypothetical protein
VLTSHWISFDESTGCLVLKATLIGFHHLKQKHTGVNIAKTILHLLDWTDLTLKVHLALSNISSLVSQFKLFRLATSPSITPRIMQWQ